MHSQFQMILRKIWNVALGNMILLQWNKLNSKMQMIFITIPLNELQNANTIQGSHENLYLQTSLELMN